MASLDPTSSKVPERKEEDLKSIGDLISDSSDMNTIYVGPENKRWSIHEAVICNKSTFFRNAFKGNFAEGKSKKMTLEDDPTVFKLFVDWIYGTADIACKFDHKDQTAEMSRHLTGWYGLAIFGDKIGSMALQKDGYGAFLSCVRDAEILGLRRSSKEIEMVFKQCPKDSPFRKYMVWTTMVDYIKPEFDDFEY